MSPSFATINWLSLNISGLTEIGSDGKITSELPFRILPIKGNQSPSRRHLIGYSLERRRTQYCINACAYICYIAISSKLVP